MAAVTPMPARGGARRPVDASPNVVPFIDLLSCCLSFLLITAVWTQLASFEVAPSSGGGAGEGVPRASPTLTIDGDGYTFAGPGEARAIPRRDGAYDVAALGDLLRRARAAQPEQPALAIRSVDGVRYDEIIRAMDVAKGARFSAISVGD